MADDIRARLEYLRGELRAERIAMSELHELQGLAEHIDPGDPELLEAAGVPEHPREARLAELMHEYPPSDPGAMGDERFALIERSTYDSSYFVTTHASVEDAARYRDGQDQPDDWAIFTLIDLDTGQTFDHETRTTFTPTAVPTE